MIVAATLLLREGVICLIIVSPVWLVCGWIGAFASRPSRARAGEPRKLNASLVLLPLLSGAAEAQWPAAPDRITLAREIVVQATPEEIWPFTVANHEIGEGEGRWTFSQNVVGMPRPRATAMHGSGVGAVRTAYWADHISFDETIVDWRPGERLAWRFRFTNNSLADYTDKHLAPDGRYLNVDSGDYTIVPLSKDRTLVQLHTTYFAKTHVGVYAQMWGEIFLGDIENNILAIIKQRAERSHLRGNAVSVAANVEATKVYVASDE